LLSCNEAFTPHVIPSGSVSADVRRITVDTRRAHFRVRPKPGEPIEVQLIGSDFLDVLDVRDISVGGLGLQVPHLFEGCNLHAQLDVVVTLPRERSFMARGMIRHVSRGNLFGLKFTDLPELARSRIERYVANRIAQGAGSS
jgi:c-di-GMP-binding flagellar brake protein YcgR